MPILVDPITASGWRYSDRAHVRALVGDRDIAIIWDLNDDGTEDAGLMEQDGVQADAYIDRWLAAHGVTVPVNTAAASGVVVQSLADIGAHLTTWLGYHHRGLDEWAAAGVRGGRSADVIGGLMQGYKQYADEELEKLVTIEELTGGDGAGEPIAAMQAVVPVREQGCWPYMYYGFG